MSDSLKSLVQTGSKLWLDSIDPDLIAESLKWGATGATSNPIIVSDLIKSGRFDDLLISFCQSEASDEEVAWLMTDALVQQAQKNFLPIWESTSGNDGYVSFEVDPLLEDPESKISRDERVSAYIELGRKWSKGHQNRMIKIPATEYGIAAMNTLAAGGIPINVTLIFTDRQYRQARNAIWKGAQERLTKTGDLNLFKSVYSIFVSRVDVYAQEHHADLSELSKGQVGIVNAQSIWAGNQEFWKERPTPLSQEIIFASTGTKNPNDQPWKYVAALAGSDIQTNPPGTLEKIANNSIQFQNSVTQVPNPRVLGEIYRVVDFERLEQTLIEEGVEKFANPHKQLIEVISEKRKAIALPQ